MAEPEEAVPIEFPPRTAATTYLGRSCGCLVVVVVLLVAWLGWSVYRWDHPTPPNVKSFAQSAATRAADRAATATANRQISGFREAAPWATYLGTSTVDACSSQGGSSSIGARPQWAPVTCRRTTAAYLAFDGDVGQRLGQLDAVTRKLGWATPPSGRQGPSGAVVAALAYQRRPSDGASPSQVKQAAARPADVFVDFTLPANKDASKGLRLQVGVAQNPGVPGNTDATYVDPSEGPHSTASNYRSVYLTWQPLSAKSVTARAYRTHAYTLAVTVTSTYATELPQAPPHGPPPDGVLLPLLQRRPQLPLTNGLLRFRERERVPATWAEPSLRSVDRPPPEPVNLFESVR